MPSYVRDPRHWYKHAKLLAISVVTELLLVLIATHYADTTVVGVITVLSITFPIMLSVSREPGVGVLTALVGAISYVPTMPASQNWGSYGMFALGWMTSAVIVAYVSLRGGQERDVASLREMRLRDQIREQILKAEEEERHRIANDLHDDTVQVLTANLLMLDAVRHRVSDPILDTSCNTLRLALHRTRSLMFELYPVVLDLEGLNPAINALVEQTAEMMQPQPETHCEVAPGRLDRASEVLAFRAVREVLQNVQKHSEATEISVVVNLEDNKATIFVADNGRGFVVKDELEKALHRPSRHLGMAGLVERIRIFRGDINIASSPGQGCSITIEIPTRHQLLKEPSCLTS